MHSQLYYPDSQLYYPDSQLYFPDTELTRPCHNLLMSRSVPGSDVSMGTFLEAVLSLSTRWKHLLPVQANQYVQSLTLSSMAQENTNKTRTTSKKDNINESSDLILF